MLDGFVKEQEEYERGQNVGCWFAMMFLLCGVVFYVLLTIWTLL
jgi:hypothetical protein